MQMWESPDTIQKVLYGASRNTNQKGLQYQSISKIQKEYKDNCAQLLN